MIAVCKYNPEPGFTGIEKGCGNPVREGYSGSAWVTLELPAIKKSYVLGA
jgi:hypothetical protein